MKEPNIVISKIESSLVDCVAKKAGKPFYQIEIRQMSIKDPTANNSTLVVLKNPKVPIRGFRNGVGKCVNLHSIMKEGCGVPDFGFDQDEETVVSKEHKDIA